MLGLSITVMSAGTIRAKSNRIIGIVAKIDRSPRPTMLVVSRGAEPRSVSIDSNTAFVKWITHKPSQQDTRSTVHALVEGRCVDVELASGQGNLAKLVRICDEPQGSVFDPCRLRRQ